MKGKAKKKKKKINVRAYISILQSKMLDRYSFSLKVDFQLFILTLKNKSCSFLCFSYPIERSLQAYL